MTIQNIIGGVCMVVSAVSAILSAVALTLAAGEKRADVRWRPMNPLNVVWFGRRLTPLGRRYRRIAGASLLIALGAFAVGWAVLKSAAC